ncbi:MAG: AMP-binding protein [Candidatus Cohnella colombiensis]|uniref:AMP-binding protein n=1 Tax=Candidatus Cohnella colombiensis TaxID=3121368 RepID=A0AA95JG27_9BACL|nr:MAG: AMP-binding protein [Cohnella sp.]
MQERELQFRDLLQRIQKSPLYQAKLSGIEIEKLRLAQIDNLPLTRKDELRKAGAFGHLAVERKRVAQYHESFGTTGEPASSWFTLDDLAVGGTQLLSCGVRLNADDMVLIRFPYAMSLPAFLMQQACWQVGAGIVPASSRTAVTPYPRVLNLMRKLQVTVLVGLPREMELLAETSRLLDAKEENQPHLFPELRAICVAGELMSERRRKHIERLWGVPVFNMFGSTETANIAVMCEYGVMHVAEQDFIVEALTEDGTASVASGERGFAAITTLSHQASPLLRYFNNDVIALEEVHCPCGNTGRKLTHYGRSNDRIQFGNVVCDAADIQDAVYSLDPVPMAWLVEEQEQGLHFKLEIEGSVSAVQDMLSEQLHFPVTVESVPVGMMLDREELVRNVPSRKPIYIRKFEQDRR